MMQQTLKIIDASEKEEYLITTQHEQQLQDTPAAEEYCAKSTLKTRGWTDRAIELFLGMSDMEVVNPRYKSAPAMKLFKLSRIKTAESSKEFQEFKEKGKSRRDSAQKSIKTKTKKLMAKISQMEIYIQRRNFEDIVQEAVESYNNFKSNSASERGDFDYQQASIDSSKEFLNRITVNFLRHRCSPYERMLDRITGKVGKRDAYALLNQRIYQKISAMYPELKQECESQLADKIMGG